MAPAMILSTIILAVVTSILAAPATVPAITAPSKRQSITSVSASTIASYEPYSYYAAAAACPPNATITWNCGAKCQQNPGFQPIASGGDGAVVQYWYVGYDPNLNTIVVGHQGTDASKILPVIEDIDIDKVTPNPSLFPGLPSGILIHAGFATGHALAAGPILTAVQSGLALQPSASVTLVGHSLGGAIALLDSVSLPLNLPAGTRFQTFTYGMPRVGNQEFADYVDANTQLTRVTNRKDPVPILPGRFLGFHHPSGENHIEDPTATWYACPGQDNTSDMCIVGQVPNVFESDSSDHEGPYGDVEMGC